MAERHPVGSRRTASPCSPGGTDTLIGLTGFVPPIPASCGGHVEPSFRPGLSPTNNLGRAEWPHKGWAASSSVQSSSLKHTLLLPRAASIWAGAEDKDQEKCRGGSWLDVTSFAAADMSLGHVEASLGEPCGVSPCPYSQARRTRPGCCHLCAHTRTDTHTHSHTGSRTHTLTLTHLPRLALERGRDNLPE